MSVMVACTAAPGGNCAFPSGNLTRKSSGVSHVFVATSIKATVSSAGYAGAKPPPSRKTFHQRKMFSRDGLPNCSFGMPFHRGLPQNSHQLFIGESRGPRATRRVAASASHSLSSRPACAGSAAVLHRLRRPSREQLCLHSRPVESTVTQLRSRCASKAFG